MGVTRTGLGGAQRAIDAYKSMASRAKLVDEAELLEYGYPAEAGKQVLVFMGHSTKVVMEDHGMIYSAAGHSLQLLNALHSITCLRKGGKERPSIYLLHYEPTIEDIEDFLGRTIRIERKTIPSKYDSLVNDIAALQQRCRAMEERIRQLESQVFGGITN